MLDQSLDTQTFVSHLECSETGKVYPADKIHNLSETGKPLLVRYDLSSSERNISLMPDRLQSTKEAVCQPHQPISS